MAKSIFPKLVILLSALGVMAPAQADWALSDSSRIGFVSIKNNSIGENNAFERVSGSISASGEVSLSVDLSSVETGVGIRNERLQKMLFEVASLYGFNVKDYRERIYILNIFQLTFSKQKQRNLVFKKMSNWDNEAANLPESINDYDWRTFQIEYRDYLDLLKLMQLIPGFGAIVGAYVNHKYTKRLGHFAMNAYRLRLKDYLNDYRHD